MAQEAEGRRLPFPRCSRQGAQKVWTERRSQALPVQQTINFSAGRQWPSSVFVQVLILPVCHGVPAAGWAVDNWDEKSSLPHQTGAEQGINPERASRPRRMQFNKEVFWLTSPCKSCLRRVSTLATRPSAGTPR